MRQLAPLLCLLLLAACGQSGDLYLPENPAPANEPVSEPASAPASSPAPDADPAKDKPADAGKDAR